MFFANSCLASKLCLLSSSSSYSIFSISSKRGLFGFLRFGLLANSLPSAFSLSLYREPALLESNSMRAILNALSYYSIFSIISLFIFKLFIPSKVSVLSSSLAIFRTSHFFLAVLFWKVFKG